MSERVMYVECRSGAAGDMLLGALLDAGLPLETLEAALGSLGVGHELVVSRVIRAGITATKVDVRSREPHDTDTPLAPAHDRSGGHDAAHAHDHDHDHSLDHRSLDDIVRLLRRSSLPEPARERAVAAFRRLGETEAAIHGVPVERVHFHEVGALDSIIDIAGVVFALDWFGITDVVVSPLNVGGGTVQIAHGRVPVPAPATLSLLKGVPIYNGGPDVELVTPTGALLLSDYARSFGPMPSMVPERIGYGAGTRDFPDIPNVVRIVIGDRAPARAFDGRDVVKIECELDDMSPQLLAPASDRLFAAGALDVFITAIQMKKGRPGHLVTVLVPPDRRDAACRVLFEETTTLGVRFETMARETLERRWETVVVSGGEVRIKVAGRDGQTLNAAPEFDDCLQAAARSGRPVKEVHAEALRAWWSRPR